MRSDLKTPFFENPVSALVSYPDVLKIYLCDVSQSFITLHHKRNRIRYSGSLRQFRPQPDMLSLHDSRSGNVTTLCSIFNFNNIISNSTEIYEFLFKMNKFYTALHAVSNCKVNLQLRTLGMGT